MHLLQIVSQLLPYAIMFAFLNPTAFQTFTRSIHIFFKTLVINLMFRCMLFKFSYEFQIYPGYLQSDELTISFKVVLRVSLFTGTICACQ